MIRSLRIGLMTAFAFAAIAAIGSASAQALAEFHCSAEPCRFTVKPDGTGKTAHHVIIVENGLGESLSLTCSQLTGEATSSTKTTFGLTITNLGYDSCTAAGAAVSTRMNGCDYSLSAVVFEFVRGRLQINCPEGKKMEFEIAATGCILTVGPQGPIEGVTYTNIGKEAEATTEITVGINLKSLAVSLDGTQAQCLINPSSVQGTYTTGSSILTGETDTGSPTMANAWFI